MRPVSLSTAYQHYIDILEQVWEPAYIQDFVSKCSLLLKTLVHAESLQAPRPMQFTKEASGASEKEDLQIALLLHVMGEEALDIFSSFTFANDNEKKD